MAERLTRLTLQERAQLAARYEVWQSVVQVQRWWRTIRGPHAQVDSKTIKNCHAKLMATGSVVDTRRSGRRSLSTDQAVNAVQEMFSRSPGKSTRQGARESGLSRHTVRAVLKKELKWRAWKPHYCQSLSDEDCDIRMEFGENMLAWHEDWPVLFQNILWSDEAVFYVGGFVNRHNCHYWAEEDPVVIAEKMQGRPKVTVWCGMTSDRIVGPFILRDTMNAERYLAMLQDDIWPVIRAWENIEDLIFMQDGAPPHFALIVRAWLDDHFRGRWLGRRGPHVWPARSPDLTPCDFFLWGWAKEEVYRTKPKTLEELEGRIWEVMLSIPQEFLLKSVDAIPG
jgi:hypothetical protein